LDILQALILGVVEGITEFLPVSSTGHLVLASNLLKIQQTEFVKTFEIAIQSGAILSVVFLYGRAFLRDLGVVKRVLVAFIPTALIGFTLYKFIKQYLIGSPEVVLLSLFLGGLVLILVEIFFKTKTHESSSTNHKSLSYERAFMIGLFQSVSMIPGVSRAAATIIGGLLVGLPRKSAVEFSFFLAVPTMLAATTLDLKETSFSFNYSQWTALAAGFITSFIVALIAVKWLLNYVKSNSFIAFGIYRIVLSVLYFLVIQR
jgi:undecaprenyl-diphosphatase